MKDNEEIPEDYYLKYPEEKNMKTETREKVVREFADVINKNSLENRSNTPDFILAEYLVCCLESFDKTSRHREDWFGKSLSINNIMKQEEGNTGVEKSTNWLKKRGYTDQHIFNRLSSSFPSKALSEIIQSYSDDQNAELRQSLSELIPIAGAYIKEHACSEAWESAIEHAKKLSI